jgi:hypothetical protein
MVPKGLTVSLQFHRETPHNISKLVQAELQGCKLQQKRFILLLCGRGTL